jgi:hypothetical protein
MVKTVKHGLILLSVGGAVLVEQVGDGAAPESVSLDIGGTLGRRNGGHIAEQVRNKTGGGFPVYGLPAGKKRTDFNFHGVILLPCSNNAVFPELPQETKPAGQPFQTVGGLCDFFPALHLFGGFLLGHDRRITGGGFAGFISGHFVILLDFDLSAALDEIHHAEHQAGESASAQNEDEKGKTHSVGLLSVCCMLHLLSVL